MVRGAFLFLRDGRVFVRCDLAGIRPATDDDRRDAARALVSGPQPVTCLLLPPGHPDSIIVPPSAC